MIETIDFSSYIIIVYIGRKRVAIVQVVIISLICCNKVSEYFKRNYG